MRKLTDVAVVTPFVKDLVAALLLQLLSTADALRRATLAIKALIQDLGVGVLALQDSRPDGR